MQIGRLGVILAAVSIATVTGSPALAGWEAVSASLTGGADGIAARTPVVISQYSYGQTFEYFAIKLDAARMTRSIIILHDLDDPGIQKIHERLVDAWKNNKKLRWFRNTGSIMLTTGNWWQGYYNTQFVVRAGDPVEMIFD